LKLCYLKYSDPKPFRSEPGKNLLVPEMRITFRVAGLIIREDEEFLLLGESAVLQDNPSVGDRVGKDLFPSYRNVLPVRKKDIIERIDFDIEE